MEIHRDAHTGALGRACVRCTDRGRYHCGVRGDRRLSALVRPLRRHRRRRRRHELRLHLTRAMHVDGGKAPTFVCPTRHACRKMAQAPGKATTVVARASADGASAFFAARISLLSCRDGISQPALGGRNLSVGKVIDPRHVERRRASQTSGRMRRIGERGAVAGNPQGMAAGRGAVPHRCRARSAHGSRRPCSAGPAELIGCLCRARTNSRATPASKAPLLGVPPTSRGHRDAIQE